VGCLVVLYLLWGLVSWSAALTLLSVGVAVRDALRSLAGFTPSSQPAATAAAGATSDEAEARSSADKTD
jgi:hypothetical protein